MGKNSVINGNSCDKGLSKPITCPRGTEKGLKNIVVGESRGSGSYLEGDSKVKMVSAQIVSGSEREHHASAAPEKQQLQASVIQWEDFLPKRSLKVMLVEDDDSTRHVVSALLRNCSYEVIAVANGLQAWKILEDMTNHIDIILTEVSMPILSGIGLLCKIMNHKTFKNVPVIMMSSRDSMGLVFRCLSKGAVDFLVKPIRKNELKNLWQHVWRRCHSSSGSGSGSGTQTKTCAQSKNNAEYGNNVDSSEESENRNTALSSQDGSGTQGSWTKRAADFDSPKQVSLQDQHQSAETPDSTCAQVIHTKPEICSSCMEQNTETKGFKEQDKGLDLELCISEFPDTHLEHHSLCLSHANSDRQDKLSMLDSRVQRTKLFDHRSESTKDGKLDHSENLITLLANDGNKSIESQAIEPPTDMSNVSRNKVAARSGSRELPSLDFCLKEQRSAENVKTSTLNGTNVLRHSDLSAFSKYNCASDSQSPTGKVGSPPPDNSSYALKTGMMPNSQSVSAFKCFQASAAKQVEHTCLPPPHSTKNDGTTPGKEEAHAKDSDQQFVQHHHHHYYHYHHHVQGLHPQSEDLGDHLITDLMVDASRCGSSDMLDGHVAGNATFRNLVGSDNNHGSIGWNGSSNESNVGVTNMESDNGEKREAAFKKFRQKRKERCFEKKVRYHSRKKLAEQRPRIRGQFVRTESDDKARIEKQDNLSLKDGSSNSIQ
ncbi:Pseudo-response regulator 7 [Heracleum sosnowskyi]|uniref:Pseudo-response regulator 7 n=1 Tax=Heracleum sosnowskyi TaxID=360622 RepID=A0AAD8N448_9APIA|nr:Pseudo-response regulator 7 [Heracleum sosnowskyi]